MIKTFAATFLKKTDLTLDVVTIEFEVQGQGLMYEPGQYLIVHIPQGQKEAARRIFSLTGVPGGTRFTFLAKIIPGGVASEYFLSLKEGGMVECAGPAGVFKMRPTQKDKLFVATGTGIAPIMSVLRTYLPNSKSQFTLLWGLKSKQDMYYYDELEELSQKYPQFRYYICLSRESSRDAFAAEYKDNIVLGRVNKKIDELLKSYELRATSYEYYICGDRDIVEDLRQHLLSLGITKEEISFEKFV